MSTTLDMSFVAGSNGSGRLHSWQSFDESKVIHMMVNHFKDVLQFSLAACVFLRLHIQRGFLDEAHLATPFFVLVTGLQPMTTACEIDRSGEVIRRMAQEPLSPLMEVIHDVFLFG